MFRVFFNIPINLVKSRIEKYFNMLSGASRFIDKKRCRPSRSGRSGEDFLKKSIENGQGNLKLYNFQTFSYSIIDFFLGVFLFFFSVWVLSNTSKQGRQIGKFSRTFPEAGNFHRSRRLWTHLLKANSPAILLHCASWYMSRITSFEISACE